MVCFQLRHYNSPSTAFGFRIDVDIYRLRFSLLECGLTRPPLLWVLLLGGQTHINQWIRRVCIHCLDSPNLPKIPVSKPISRLLYSNASDVGISLRSYECVSQRKTAGKQMCSMSSMLSIDGRTVIEMNAALNMYKRCYYSSCHYYLTRRSGPEWLRHTARGLIRSLPPTSACSHLASLHPQPLHHHRIIGCLLGERPPHRDVVTPYGRPWRDVTASCWWMKGLFLLHVICGVSVFS